MRWTLALLVSCWSTTTTPPDRTCTDIEADYATELAAVQSCAAPEDCGQVLDGTSCGCTRDLVARLDADTAPLYALIDEGQAESCAIPLTSVCDCPATAGFDCVSGVCTWNYVDDDPYLAQCTAAGGDPLTITSAALDGTELVVNVTYGGGCAEHDFTLCWPDQSFAESEPVQATLELYHDDHDDECDAVLYEELRFSLDPLIAGWRAAYQAKSGTITVHIGEHTVSLVF